MRIHRRCRQGPAQDFRQEKDADRFRGEVEVDVRMGKHTPDATSLRVSALAEEFIEHLAVRHGQGRRMGLAGMNYQSASIRNYIVPALGAKLIKDVSFEHVEAFAREFGRSRVRRVSSSGQWATRGIGQNAHETRVLQGMHPKTVKAHLNVLKLMFDYAMRRKYTGRNPAAEVVSDRRGDLRQEIRLWSSDDL